MPPATPFGKRASERRHKVRIDRICPLPSPDWSASTEYAPSPRPIGPHRQNMPPLVAYGSGARGSSRESGRAGHGHAASVKNWRENRILSRVIWAEGVQYYLGWCALLTYPLWAAGWGRVQTPSGTPRWGPAGWM
eukprot:522270-Prorocentrum_minimum.AAC.1